MEEGNTHNVPVAQTHRARTGGWWWGRAEEGWAPAITYDQRFAVGAIEGWQGVPEAWESSIVAKTRDQSIHVTNSWALSVSHRVAISPSSELEAHQPSFFLIYSAGNSERNLAPRPRLERPMVVLCNRMIPLVAIPPRTFGRRHGVDVPARHARLITRPSERPVASLAVSPLRLCGCSSIGGQTLTGDECQCTPTPSSTPPLSHRYAALLQISTAHQFTWHVERRHPENVGKVIHVLITV